MRRQAYRRTYESVGEGRAGAQSNCMRHQDESVTRHFTVALPGTMDGERVALFRVSMSADGRGC